jgi:hypothetical protein
MNIMHGLRRAVPANSTDVSVIDQDCRGALCIMLVPAGAEATAESLARSGRVSGNGAAA